MRRTLSADQFIAHVVRATSRPAAVLPELRTVATDLVEENLTVGGAHGPGTPVDTGHALSGWDRMRVGPVDLVTNPVDYMPALNRGHSPQARQGIIGPVRRAWPQIVAEARAIVARGQARGGWYAA